MNAGRLRLVALLVLMSTLSTGCWDARDVNDRTPAIAMSFDHDRHGWLVSIQEVTQLPSDSKSAIGGAEVGRGPTLTDAVENLRAELDKALYIGSAKLYVIGPGVLHGRLPEVTSYLRQHVEVDTTGYLLATAEPAAALLTKPDPIAGLTTLHLLEEFERETVVRDGATPVHLWDVFRRSLTPGETNLVPFVGTSYSGTISALGMALLDEHGELKTVVDRGETVTLRWIMNKGSQVVIGLPDGSAAKVLSLKAARSFPDARTVRLKIAVVAEGHIVPGPMTSAMSRTFAAAIATSVSQRVTALLQKLRTAGANVPDWREAAAEAGYPGFDLSAAAVYVQVKVQVVPIVAPYV